MIDEQTITREAYKYGNGWANIIARSSSVDGFMNGARWAQKEVIKSLWHDAQEQPKKGETCLVYARFTYEDKEPIEDYFTSTYTTYGWTEDWFPNDYEGEIKRWCYLSDILPEGGEQ